MHGWSLEFAPAYVPLIHGLFSDHAHPGDLLSGATPCDLGHPIIV